MRDLNEIIEKIQELKKLKNKTQIAVTLDMTSEALSKHKERKTLPLQQLLNFCQKEDISFDWLVMGKGEANFQPAEKEATLKDVDAKINKILNLLNKTK